MQIVVVHFIQESFNSYISTGEIYHSTPSKTTITLMGKFSKNLPFSLLLKTPFLFVQKNSGQGQDPLVKNLLL